MIIFIAGLSYPTHPHSSNSRAKGSFDAGRILHSQRNSPAIVLVYNLYSLYIIREDSNC